MKIAQARSTSCAHLSTSCAHLSPPRASLPEGLASAGRAALLSGALPSGVLPSGVLSLLRAPLLLLCAALSLGCSCGEDPAAQSAPVADPVSPPASDPATAEAPRQLGSRQFVGPRLLVQPGKGVGPIYIGATVETIERHMEAPCDIKTQDRCVYVKQAVEFFLEDGVMARVKAHFRDRPVAGSDEPYGTFNGGMLPEILMGLHRHVVVEEFGKPQRTEAVALSGATGLVERAFYDGVILEYEKIENGNVVLAGFEVVPLESKGAQSSEPVKD